MSGMSFGRSFGGPSRGGAAGYTKPMAPPSGILRPPPQPYSYSDVIQHRVQPGFAAAYGPDGRRLTVDQGRDLGPLYHAGWNTSGVGPGTPGYRGSWRPGGYNYGMGTGRPSARTSGEYYAQRDMVEGNPLRQLSWNEGRGQPWRGNFAGNALMQTLVDEVRGKAQPQAAPAAASTPSLAPVSPWNFLQNAMTQAASTAQPAPNPSMSAPAAPTTAVVTPQGNWTVNPYGSGYSTFGPRTDASVVNNSDVYDPQFTEHASAWQGEIARQDAVAAEEAKQEARMNEPWRKKALDLLDRQARGTEMIPSFRRPGPQPFTPEQRAQRERMNEIQKEMERGTFTPRTSPSSRVNDAASRLTNWFPNLFRNIHNWYYTPQ